MVLEKTLELEIDHRFDAKRCRHLQNSQTYVLHCHHYTTLYAQLADDARNLDGPACLIRSAELAFHPVFTRIFEAQGATLLDDRINLVEEYWQYTGMGLVTFERVGPLAGLARMDSSHLDEGWLKKWGTHERPVNFVGQGFLAAAMAAFYGLPAGSFRSMETESIVMGAEASRFSIVRV